MALFAIILAAGKGERAGGGVPKQFRLLAGKSVYAHSIESFTRYSADCRFVVVVPSDGNHNIPEVDNIKTVRGGSTRFESVHAALCSIADEADEDDIIAIHDGARPLLRPQMIGRGVDCVLHKGGGAIPAVPLTDSIRKIENEKSVSVDRSRYMAVQTPQIFRFGDIAKAYDEASQDIVFTDDASVFESLFPGRITLYQGEADNIKITNPKDFEIAEVLMRK